MQETRNNCFRSKMRSMTLCQAKTGKHEYRNIITTHKTPKVKIEPVFYFFLCNIPIFYASRRKYCFYKNSQFLIFDTTVVASTTRKQMQRIKKKKKNLYWVAFWQHTLLLYFGTRAYLFSSDEGSCYVFCTRNNCCVFLASYGVIILSVIQLYLKTPVFGDSLSYECVIFVLYVIFKEVWWNVIMWVLELQNCNKLPFPDVLVTKCDSFF